MRKGLTAFLIGAFVVTILHAGVARALTCTYESTPTTGNPLSQCYVTGDGTPCPHGTQITGGACSSDPALPLVSSEVIETPGVTDPFSWRCTYQLPTVGDVCQGLNNVTITATSICCK